MPKWPMEKVVCAFCSEAVVAEVAEVCIKMCVADICKIIKYNRAIIGLGLLLKGLHQHRLHNAIFKSLKFKNLMFYTAPEKEKKHL